jgi:hypothetical protein
MGTTQLTNPYLTIDKKYFSNSLEGQFVITQQDLVNMPVLRNLVNVSYLQENQINFSEFTIAQKIEIGLIFFEYYHYIVWVGDKKYMDFNKIKEAFPNQESIISEINSLTKLFYYNEDISTGLYDLEIINDKLLLLLITYYFYSKYSDNKDSVKYITSTKILTDVNLNKYHYTKLSEDVLFIVGIFNNWILTNPNDIPFSPNYGNPLKELIQEKNSLVKLTMVRTSIITFFEELSSNYNQLLELMDVSVKILGNYGVDISIVLKINKNTINFNLSAYDN